MKLSDLKQGHSGIITDFTDADLGLKLMEMGCLPGEKILIENIAPFGDPIAIMISGYKLSLRRSEAEAVLLKAE